MKVYFVAPLKDILKQEQGPPSLAAEKSHKIRERTIRKSL